MTKHGMCFFGPITSTIIIVKGEPLTILFTEAGLSLNTGVKHSKVGEWPWKRDYQSMSLRSGFGDEAHCVFDLGTYWQSGQNPGKVVMKAK